MVNKLPDPTLAELQRGWFTHIGATCKQCSHTGWIRVDGLVAKFGPDTRWSKIRRMLVCSICMKKKITASPVYMTRVPRTVKMHEHWDWVADQKQKAKDG